jgi:hypothetical protein
VAQPSIITILVDDMGYSDLGCYGGEVETPTLDRLDGNGVRFTDFHCTPRCCPSRASLLTGVTPHKAGVGWMSFDWAEHVDPDADGYTGTLNHDCLTAAASTQSGPRSCETAWRGYNGYSTTVQDRRRGRVWRECEFRRGTRPPACHDFGRTARDGATTRRRVR